MFQRSFVLQLPIRRARQAAQPWSGRVGIMVIHNPSPDPTSSIAASGSRLRCQYLCAFCITLSSGDPASGYNAEATQRIRMMDARNGQPTVNSPQHPVPQHATVLTAPRQCTMPEPHHLEPKRAQRGAVHEEPQINRRSTLQVDPTWPAAHSDFARLGVASVELLYRRPTRLEQVRAPKRLLSCAVR